jgi:hypothetical protein
MSVAEQSFWPGLFGDIFNSKGLSPGVLADADDRQKQAGEGETETVVHVGATAFDLFGNHNLPIGGCCCLAIKRTIGIFLI